MNPKVDGELRLVPGGFSLSTGTPLPGGLSWDLDLYISHDRAEETPEAKARWFQSLTMEERARYLCEMTELILQNNPRILESKNVEPVEGRIRVLTLPGM